MRTDSQSSDWVTDEISREIARIHEDNFGLRASNPRVAVHDDFVAVVMEVELTPAEEALARSGNGAAVRTTREEFADTIRAVYEAVIERSTGRRVEAFASRVAPEHERPWTAEIFLLGPPTASE